jgi:hypothetical protein
MIRQLLDPRFVKARVADLEAYLAKREKHLEKLSPEVRKAAGKAGVTPGDLDQAQQMLAELGGRADFSRREREAAWMPRDPRLGIVQSALEEFYRTEQATQIVAPKRLEALPDPVSDDSLKPDWIPTAKRSFMRQMEQSDLIGWGLSFAVARAIAGARGKTGFPIQKDPAGIASKVRLILMADWASGVKRAKNVGDQIKEQLKPANAGDRECHVIHLGDVYYAGREFEYERLKSSWPVNESDASKVGSWCLNGNHDMYSGGKPLFDFLTRDTRFSRQKGCSYFALENADWLIFGLDSAYESDGTKGDAGGLAAPQTEWIMTQIRRAPQKKVILLSHHQPFSAWENESPAMVAALEPLLKGPREVAAWFWGHEHRCAVYEKAHNIRYPALIGHGGVPVYASKKEPDPAKEKVKFWDQRSFPHLLEHYAYLGFAVLDLDGPQGSVQYLDENGKPTKPGPDRVE